MKVEQGPGVQISQRMQFESIRLSEVQKRGLEEVDERNVE